MKLRLPVQEDHMPSVPIKGVKAKIAGSNFQGVSFYTRKILHLNVPITQSITFDTGFIILLSFFKQFALIVYTFLCEIGFYFDCDIYLVN